MSIRWQILTALLAVVAVFTVVTIVVQRAIVLSSFEVLETRLIQRDIALLSRALREEMENLSILSRDWAARPEVHVFPADQHTADATTDLSRRSLSSARLSLVALLDARGRPHFSRVLDRRDNALLPTPEFLRGASDELVSHFRVSSPDGCRRGLIQTELGPFLVAGAPILTGPAQEQVDGTLLVGRLLDRQALDALGERLLLTLTTVPPGAPSRSSGDASTGPSSAWMDQVITSVDANTLAGDLLLRDMRGRPVVYLRTIMPRAVTWQGNIVTTVAAALSVCAGLCAMIVLWMTLNKTVIGPILHIANHAVALGETEDLSAQLNLNTSDEIGTLAAEFDRMVVCLRKSRDQLVEMAHRAGMAEVATDVLHNVGNSLNSVGTSLDCIDERLERSRIPQLHRAVTLLREHRQDLADFLRSPAKGAKWPEYVEKLAASLQQDRGQILAEVQAARNRLAYVREVVASQQTYASGPAFVQQIELLSLVEDVLKLFQSDLDGHRIAVERAFGSVPTVVANRTRLMQVLGNLVQNAIEAMGECPLGAALLRVTVRPDSGAAVAVEIADTGPGISQDVLPRLFAQGFTTKPEGHGLGLHFCANAMNNMNGSITVHSEGHGRGAKFTVRVPTVTTAEHGKTRESIR